MNQIRIEGISGGTFPISVYIADSYGNNRYFIDTINPGPVPPPVRYNSTIPDIFEGVPQIMLILVDANGCERFELLPCTFGCSFEITFEFVD